MFSKNNKNKSSKKAQTIIGNSCIIEIVNKIKDYHGLRKLEFDVTIADCLKILKVEENNSDFLIVMSLI